PVVAELRRLKGAMPPAVKDLDHVPADAESTVKRAVFLRRTFDLRQARVVMLGDRDLTAVALTMLEPAARVAVVDVDQAVLGRLAAWSQDSGHTLTTLFGDLRLGLPRSLAGS